MISRDPSTKERILKSAYNLFYREGFSRVSVDAIAAHAKLTKRTVYYHFKSKDDIVAAALDDLHQHLMPQMRKWVGTDATGSTEMIRNLFAELQAWTDRKPWLGSGFSRIAAELADLPGHPARHAARTHKESVENWLADMLASGGQDDPARCARQIMIIIEGAMSLSLIHGNTEYIRTAGMAAETLLLEPAN